MKDVQLLAISLVHQAYELNEVVSNGEMLLYKIFTSPDLTKDTRAGSDDLLAGNLFAHDGIKLGASVYKSLLETVALYPKKKHLKKIVEHLIKYEGPEHTTPETIDLIIRICIDQKLPVFLGQTMKYLM